MKKKDKGVEFDRNFWQKLKEERDEENRVLCELLPEIDGYLETLERRGCAAGSLFQGIALKEVESEVFLELSYRAIDKEEVPLVSGIRNAKSKVEKRLRHMKTRRRDELQNSLHEIEWNHTTLALMVGFLWGVRTMARPDMIKVDRQAGLDMFPVLTDVYPPLSEGQAE